MVDEYARGFGVLRVSESFRRCKRGVPLARQLDAKRIEAESEAFDGLVGELAKTWRAVVATHAGAARSNQPPSDIL
ncbi:MAG: hypothetical protein FJ091_07485 [Deltaproteobacteria bacterium]|nr:hypothetical protein [Deltaproteobacteria bacterium]